MASLLGQALSISVFMLLASGCGALLARLMWPAAACSRASRNYVTGFLAFATLYCLARGLNAPFGLAVGGTLAFLAVGAAGLAVMARGNRTGLLRHGQPALVIGVAWLLSARVAGNAGAIDPWMYAAEAALAFQPDWLATHTTSWSSAADLLATFDTIAIARRGTGAILWPIVAQGNGIGVGEVTRAGLGLLLAAALMLADLVPLPRSPLARIGIGIGAIGVYNAIAILSGGQLQQTFAVFIVVACMWLIRRMRARWSAALIGMCAFLLAACYPEFLIALPLYVALIAIARPQPLGVTLVQFVAALGGFLVEQALTRGALLPYIFSQSSEAPGWAPLPGTPDWLGAVIGDLLLQTRPPAVALLLVAVVGVVVWLRWRPAPVCAPIPPHAIVVLAAVCLIWAVALMRSQNLNYAVFKLAGWLGPGVVLLGFYLAAALQGRWQRVALSVAVMFAFARLAALVYGSNEVLTLAQVDAAQAWPRNDVPGGGCEVLADSADMARIAAAIAGSAAPLFGCELVVAH